MTDRVIPTRPVTNEPIVRLIPAAILQPRVRLIESGEVIEGQAFDMEAILAESNSPFKFQRATPDMQKKVMASFDFSRNSRNRFNDKGDEGVYYAGTTLPAAMEEIRWHLEHDEGVPFDKTRIYRAVIAKANGNFLDLREIEAKELSPDVKLGYPPAQELARRVRPLCDGIIYPSARHPDGVCMAIFNPESISDIKIGQCVSFEPLPGPERKFGYRMHVQPHQVAQMTDQQRAFA